MIKNPVTAVLSLAAVTAATAYLLGWYVFGVLSFLGLGDVFWLLVGGPVGWTLSDARFLYAGSVVFVVAMPAAAALKWWEP